MSSRDAVVDALTKAHASQPLLNAFTHLDDKAALERAEELDRSRDADRVSSLRGLPFAIKDLIDQTGRTTTNGSAFYQEIASATAPAVQRIETAGAVAIGRTGLHEFAFGFSSENPHWGAVHNPWNLAHSTGGSSGGSGAVVGAGIVPVALGTDTGGSVRVPAALCGTYGLKVTHGRIPLDGVFPLVPSLDTVGPLASSVAHAESAYRAMSGDRAPAPTPVNPVVGIPEPWFSEAPMANEVADDFDQLTAALGRIGWVVRTVEVPNAKPTPRLWNAMAREVTEVHRGYRDRGEPYGEDVQRRLDEAAEVTVEMAEDGRKWQEALRSDLETVFGEIDFLMTPTVPVREKVIGRETIGDAHYRSVLSYFSAVVNHALTPAMAAPLWIERGPATSLQLIGRWKSETGLLGAMARLEAEGLTRFRAAPNPFR